MVLVLFLNVNQAYIRVTHWNPKQLAKGNSNAKSWNIVRWELLRDCTTLFKLRNIWGRDDKLQKVFLEISVDMGFKSHFKSNLEPHTLIHLFISNSPQAASLQLMSSINWVTNLAQFNRSLPSFPSEYTVSWNLSTTGKPGCLLTPYRFW